MIQTNVQTGLRILYFRRRFFHFVFILLVVRLILFILLFIQIFHAGIQILKILRRILSYIFTDRGRSIGWCRVRVIIVLLRLTRVSFEPQVL